MSYVNAAYIASSTLYDWPSVAFTTLLLKSLSPPTESGPAIPKLVIRIV